MSRDRVAAALQGCVVHGTAVLHHDAGLQDRLLCHTAQYCVVPRAKPKYLQLTQQS